MLEKLKDIMAKMFSENSSVSMMRVMSLLSLIVGCVVAFVGLGKHDPAGLSVLVGVFVGSAFGGKVLQKVQELKGKDDGSS